ncbi:MAG: SLBB domain-containing protein, partial [Nitrospirota bacterium]
MNQKKISFVMILTGILLFSAISYAQEGGPVISPTPGAPPLPIPVAPPNAPSFPSPTPEQIQKGKEILQQQAAFEKPAEKPATTGAPAMPTVKGLSPFEAYIQGKSPLSISTDIRQFGYELFEQPPTTFAPVDVIPVGPDYILGPGDELRITVWGKVNAEYPAIVDRDGKISLPQMGILHLSGLTFSEAKEYLEKELSRYYKPSDVKMNVSMGRLRSIRVFVVGKTQRPGSYTLSSFSTLINALFAAGGPSKAGSLRDIQIRRNGGTIVHFDLYDFLLKGDKTKDVRLMPEDVIFIPPVGPLVGVAGHVNSPAIYELKGEIRLQEIIEMAGGVSATGYLQQVQVERVFENKAKIVLDLNLKELTENGNISLKDGDAIKVFSIINMVTNSVEFKGNLLRPGTYEWREGIRVRDIIKGTDVLLPDTHLEFALVERLVPPDYHKEYLAIGLRKLLLEGDEKENIPLMPYDTVVV